MAKPTEDIQYLSTLPNSALVELAETNPTPQLAIVLAERLAVPPAHGRSAKRVAPNHPAFIGA